MIQSIQYLLDGSGAVARFREKRRCAGGAKIRVKTSEFYDVRFRMKSDFVNF